MEKIELRAVIKSFFFFRGFSAKETKSELDAVLRDASSQSSIVSFWISEFRRGRKHPQGEPWSRRPETARVRETVGKIHRKALADPEIPLRVSYYTQ